MNYEKRYLDFFMIICITMLKLGAKIEIHFHFLQNVVII